MTFAELTRRLPMRWLEHRAYGPLLQGVGVLAGVGAALAGYAFLREPLQVRLDRVTVRLPHAQGRLPRRGLRILHLSDTHFRGEHWRELPKIDSIRRACAGLDYDLLIHTGDFLHYDSGMPNVLALLDRLPRPRLGAYAVFGNHDYMTYSHAGMVGRAWARFCAAEGEPQAASPRARTWLRFGRYFANSPLALAPTGPNDVDALETALAERGIHTLHNRTVRLTHGIGGPDAVDVYLAGVEDIAEGTPDLKCALAGIPEDAPTILLSHNPDILWEPGIERVDLVLAGHTHGGQIVLPWLGAAHTQSQYLHRHEVSGYMQRGRTQVYITRGIGEGIPLRFGAAPQVTLLTVIPE